jgi:hypothetical protein
VRLAFFFRGVTELIALAPYRIQAKVMFMQPQSRIFNGRVTWALVLASAVALLTVSVGQLSLYTELLIVFCIPGMIGSMAVSNNVHAFHLWVAAIFNFVFYFALTWSIVGLGLRLFRKKT